MNHQGSSLYQFNMFFFLATTCLVLNVFHCMVTRDFGSLQPCMNKGLERDFNSSIVHSSYQLYCLYAYLFNVVVFSVGFSIFCSIMLQFSSIESGCAMSLLYFQAALCNYCTQTHFSFICHPYHTYSGITFRYSLSSPALAIVCQLVHDPP